MTDEPTAPSLTTQVNGGDTLVTLSGDWTIRNDGEALAMREAWLTRQIATSGRELDELLRTAQATATQAEALAASLNALTADGSPLSDDLQSSVRDLADSAGSLRVLTRELERNPLGTLFKKAPQ